MFIYDFVVFPGYLLCFDLLFIFFPLFLYIFIFFLSVFFVSFWKITGDTFSNWVVPPFVFLLEFILHFSLGTINYVPEICILQKKIFLMILFIETLTI